MDLKIEYLPLKALKPYERNARKHGKEDVEAVAACIRETGFNDPIGIWSDKNIIVEGHGRLLAAKKLGMKEVPCIRLDHLTDEQRKAYSLAHNKTAELSSWDADLLNLELEDITDIDMEQFGFDLPDPLADMEAVDDDYEISVPEQPKAKYGEIYQLGRHRLMCGDSTVLGDVQKLVENVQMDLLITDPPYNVDYEGTAGKIKNDSMKDDKFREFLTDAFKNAAAVMKPGASFYIWHADSEGYNFRQACFNAGWQVRQCLIWNKNSLVLGRQDYQWKHEPCLYGWKEGAGHQWHNDRKQTTVMDYDRPKKNAEHPTMKPVPLFDYEIRNSTKEGDLVLDLFGGSGTTIMACEQDGRNAYVMELDPKYVDVIIDRYEAFTGGKAVLLNGEEGKTEG